MGLVNEKEFIKQGIECLAHKLKTLHLTMALAPSLTQRNTLAYLSKFCGCSSQVKPQCLSEVLAVMISMQTPPAGKLPMQALSEIPRCSGLQHHFPSVSSCCDMEET